MDRSGPKDIRVTVRGCLPRTYPKAYVTEDDHALKLFDGNGATHPPRLIIAIPWVNLEAWEET